MVYSSHASTNVILSEAKDPCTPRNRHGAWVPHPSASCALGWDSTPVRSLVFFDGESAPIMSKKKEVREGPRRTASNEGGILGFHAARNHGIFKPATKDQQLPYCTTRRRRSSRHHTPAVAVIVTV